MVLTHQAVSAAAICAMVVHLEGDQNLLLNQKWLELMLVGDKIMEVLGRQLKPGVAFFGWKGSIYTATILGDAVEIHDI